MRDAFLILMTKSYKGNGYCVAGFDVQSGKWIRLVSSRTSDNAISKEVIDNTGKKCLDVVSVSLLEHIPHACQTENYLIDEKKQLVTVDSKKITDLLTDKYLTKTPYIFLNNYSSLNEKQALSLNHSLCFVIVENLVIQCFFDNIDEKWCNKCTFEYNGVKYSEISLTDPNFRREDCNGACIKKAAIVVSLAGEPFGWYDMYYKFVAKIFVL